VSSHTFIAQQVVGNNVHELAKDGSSREAASLPSIGVCVTRAMRRCGRLRRATYRRPIHHPADPISTRRGPEQVRLDPKLHAQQTPNSHSQIRTTACAGFNHGGGRRVSVSSSRRGQEDGEGKNKNPRLPLCSAIRSFSDHREAPEFPRIRFHGRRKSVWSADGEKLLEEEDPTEQLTIGPHGSVSEGEHACIS
jgi:hypothetical protein